MKITSPYEYHDLDSITDKETGVRQYVTPEGDKLYSVTTILSATKDDEGLKQWRQYVGDKKADEIVKEATGHGSLMHADLENYILGKDRISGNHIMRKNARRMADLIINQGLCKVDEVWGIEAALYYPGLYAGRSDLIGVFNGVPAIMDFKNSRKIKKEEYVQDYYLQLTAYALAHNELYGTDINRGVIFMASREFEYKTFYLDEVKFADCVDQWLRRVEHFYKNPLRKPSDLQSLG